MSLGNMLCRYGLGTSKMLRVMLTQQRGFADAHSMSFTFASPSRVFYNKEDVRQVDVPSFSGSFGILPNHVPLLAVLKPGVVTVIGKDSSKKYFVSSGSVTINDDSTVQLLAEEAVFLEDLDAQAAKQGLSAAQQQLASATTEKAKAEAMIAIEVHEALAKAVE